MTMPYQQLSLATFTQTGTSDEGLLSGDELNGTLQLYVRYLLYTIDPVLKNPLQDAP